MTTDAAFLDAVIASPDDDAPRLIYADWLEEHGGQPERAEFIRLQCRLAKGCTVCDGSGRNVMSPCPCSVLRRREKELESVPLTLWRQWCAPLVELGPDVTWTMRRGFVEEITIPGSLWLAHGDELAQKVPLRKVALTTWPTMDELSGLSSSSAPRIETVLRQRWPNIIFELPPCVPMMPETFTVTFS